MDGVCRRLLSPPGPQVSKVGPLAGSSAAEVDAWEKRHAMAQTRPGALPPHRYIMMLEPFTWVINNNADGAGGESGGGGTAPQARPSSARPFRCPGNLTDGWTILNGTHPPHNAPSGGPSIRYSPLDGAWVLEKKGGNGWP